MAQEIDPRMQYEPRETYDETTGWVGWIIFAGTMMIIGGSLNALQAWSQPCRSHRDPAVGDPRERNGM